MCFIYLFSYFLAWNLNGGDFCNVCAHIKQRPNLAVIVLEMGVVLALWQHDVTYVWHKTYGKRQRHNKKKIIRNYDQFGSGLVYFIEINVIVCNVYSAQEYMMA